MKIKAIKKGNSLQLKENINVPDGQEIIIFIDDYELQSQKKSVKWEDFEEVIGAWKDDEEITQIFEEINQERHQDLGREVSF